MRTLKTLWLLTGVLCIFGHRPERGSYAPVTGRTGLIPEGSDPAQQEKPGRCARLSYW